MTTLFAAGRTSEFWSAIFVALGGVLVQFGVLTPAVEKFAEMVLAGFVAYIIARSSHKLANGGVPFQPLPPKK